MLIYKALLSYAVAKGVINGLKKPRPKTVAQVAEILKRLYLEPISWELNSSPMLLNPVPSVSDVQRALDTPEQRSVREKRNVLRHTRTRSS